MLRRPHELSIPKKVTFPRHVIFFDTETKEEYVNSGTKSLTLRLGYCRYMRFTRDRVLVPVSELSFYNSVDFGRYILGIARGNEAFWVVAHNISFDVRVTDIMGYLYRDGWERTLLIEEGLNFIASYRKGRTTIKFINNQQLFNVSLKRLGESIGEYKEKVDFSSAGDGELMAYCRQDVNVMVAAWQVWARFISENNLGSFRITAASQAMGAYRHRFKKTKIDIHTDPRAIRLERSGYHGGRVECFFLGSYTSGKVYHLDINSMYPYVMHAYDYPVSLQSRIIYPSVAKLKKLSQTYALVARVTLNTSSNSYPYLSGGRLVFPKGTFDVTLGGCELDLALDTGSVVLVHECNIYKKGQIFKEYVDFFYTKRLEYKQAGNDSFSYLCKILLNSLYGKFGQKQLEYRISGYSDRLPDGLYKTPGKGKPGYGKMRVLHGVIEESVGFREGYNSFVAIASHITANARYYLNNLIETAGRENVLYCDTDSLFVTEQGYNALYPYINHTSLGKLKLVGVNSGITIYAPKWYKFGDKTVLKGIRDNAVLVAERTFEQDKFMGFRAALRTQNLEGVFVSKVTKHLNPSYHKGIIAADGRVFPLTFSPALDVPLIIPRSP